jgi:hypothetical protein
MMNGESKEQRGENSDIYFIWAKQSRHIFLAGAVKSPQQRQHMYVKVKKRRIFFECQ